MHLMIVIGCGGGFFHGLSLMRNWLAKRDDDVRVVLVDGDVVEPRNRLRQWAQAGRLKVDCAREALVGLGFVDEKMTTLPVMLNDRMIQGQGGMMVGSSLNPQEMGLAFGEEYHRVWVVIMPDNHRARVMGMVLGNRLHDMTGMDTVVCTSGNSGDAGFAYLGYLRKGQEMLNDWLRAHPDIEEEALLEERMEQQHQQELAAGIACGTMPDTGGITQTATSNVMSSVCRWQALERAAQEYGGWDYYWQEEEGELVISHRVRGVIGTRVERE